MNKRQKLVQQTFLDNEEEVLKRLEKIYGESLSDIEKKAQKLQDEIEELDKLAKLSISEEEKEVLLSRKRAKVYQKQYQESLKKQVNEILDKMHTEEFKTVSEYLDKCYEEGFVGTLYDLQGQGLPLAFPIDQESMVRAVQLDSKISKGLYSRLGEDVSKLKKMIASDVSRGISTGMTFKQIAGQLKAKTNIGYNNAVRIARTEGHRIQCQAGMDACFKAKEIGADVVKQWCATLDDRTRESHWGIHNQVREIDKPFSNGLMFPGDPRGSAAEVINCRCALLQRARKALFEDDIETEYIGDIGKMTDKQKEMLAKKLNVPIDELEQYSKQIIPINAKDYDDFKKKYNGIWNYESSDFKKEVEANMANRGIVINPKTQRPSKISSADKEQFERYKSVLGEIAPQTLDKFYNLKYNKEGDWNTLKNQYRTVNRYSVDGNVTAKKILELDEVAFNGKKNDFDLSAFKGKELRKMKKDIVNGGNAASMEFDGKFYFSHSKFGLTGSKEHSLYKGKYPTVALSQKRIFDVIDLGDGIPRQYDTEAKFLEFVASKKNTHDTFTVNILSEKHICKSCQGVVEQFKKRFPNSTVNIVSGKKAYNGSEEGLHTWKHRKG